MTQSERDNLRREILAALSNEQYAAIAAPVQQLLTEVEHLANEVNLARRVAIEFQATALELVGDQVIEGIGTPGRGAYIARHEVRELLRSVAANVRHDGIASFEE